MNVRFDTRLLEAGLAGSAVLLLGLWVVLLGLAFTDPGQGPATATDRTARVEPARSRPAPGATRTFIAAVLYRSASPAPDPRALPRRTRAAGAPPAVVGRIEMPRSGISALLTESGSLVGAAASAPDPVLKHPPSLAVFAGHEEAFYRGLGQMRPGDPIRLTTADGEADYRVEDTAILSAADSRSLAGTPQGSLMLVASLPFLPGPVRQRLVVRARPQPAS